mmetsp:Transcript_12815/g.31412  ORF Transcript_12815/g.31412 Transcript_12815/m.31412 type:complete len:522 (-) Transcript_12815:782-2347(-)
MHLTPCCVANRQHSSPGRVQAPTSLLSRLRQALIVQAYTASQVAQVSQAGRRVAVQSQQLRERGGLVIDVRHPGHRAHHWAHQAVHVIHVVNERERGDAGHTQRLLLHLLSRGWRCGRHGGGRGGRKGHGGVHCGLQRLVVVHELPGEAAVATAPLRHVQQGRPLGLHVGLQVGGQGHVAAAGRGGRGRGGGRRRGLRLPHTDGGQAHSLQVISQRQRLHLRLHLSHHGCNLLLGQELLQIPWLLVHQAVLVRAVLPGQGRRHLCSAGHAGGSRGRRHVVAVGVHGHRVVGLVQVGQVVTVVMALLLLIQQHGHQVIHLLRAVLHVQARRHLTRAVHSSHGRGRLVALQLRVGRRGLAVGQGGGGGWVLQAVLRAVGVQVARVNLGRPSGGGRGGGGCKVGAGAGGSLGRLAGEPRSSGGGDSGLGGAAAIVGASGSQGGRGGAHGILVVGADRRGRVAAHGAEGLQALEHVAQRLDVRVEVRQGARDVGHGRRHDGVGPLGARRHQHGLLLALLRGCVRR